MNIPFINSFNVFQVTFCWDSLRHFALMSFDAPPAPLSLHCTPGWLALHRHIWQTSTFANDHSKICVSQNILQSIWSFFRACSSGLWPFVRPTLLEFWYGCLVNPTDWILRGVPWMYPDGTWVSLISLLAHRLIMSNQTLTGLSGRAVKWW